MINTFPPTGPVGGRVLVCFMLSAIENAELSKRPYGHIDQLNIVFKISERCNLACDYCYFFFGEDESWKQHPPTASISALEATAQFFYNVALSYGLPRIVFILHGGEPLLVRKAHFRKMCELLRSFDTPSFSFEIGLQTNAILVDDDWIKLFEEFHIDVGVSLDGNKTINDLHRLDKQGRSSYEGTVEGLRKLQKAAQAGRMPLPGIICVIQPEANGTETYRHFVDDLGIEKISFRTLDLMHSTSLDKDTVAATNQFLLDALHEWLKDNNGRIKIRQFSEPMRAMLSDKYADLVALYQEDARNIISVSSNGDIGPDDSLKAFDNRFVAMGLNVFSSKSEDLFSSKVWEELEHAASRKPELCKTCRWWNICKGGRLVTRFSKENGLNNASVYCEGLKGIYQTVENALLGSGIPADAINRRLNIQCEEGAGHG